MLGHIHYCCYCCLEGAHTRGSSNIYSIIHLQLTTIFRPKPTTRSSSNAAGISGTKLSGSENRGGVRPGKELTRGLASRRRAVERRVAGARRLMSARRGG